MKKFLRDLGIALILCFGLHTILGTCDLEQSQGTKLRLVSVIFRHGDRTADVQKNESYPNDPYKDYGYYPYGNGQLTNVGKKRVHQLGLMLKNRYNSFLGNMYYQPYIYARSTMFPRTKMSLLLVFAALYPPTDMQKWNPLLLWQPVDFTYINITHDQLLFPIQCPVYIRLYNDMVENNITVKEKIAKFAGIMKELSIYTGKNMTTMFHLNLLYQTLLAEESFGLHLPKWTQDLFPNGALLDAAILQFNLFSYGTLLNKLNGGIFESKTYFT